MAVRRDFSARGFSPRSVFNPYRSVLLCNKPPRNLETEEGNAYCRRWSIRSAGRCPGPWQREPVRARLTACPVPLSVSSRVCLVQNDSIVNRPADGWHLAIGKGVWGSRVSPHPEASPGVFSRRQRGARDGEPGLGAGWRGFLCVLLPNGSQGQLRGPAWGDGLAAR